jgi:hypothetical protein
MSSFDLCIGARNASGPEPEAEIALDEPDPGPALPNELLLGVMDLLLEKGYKKTLAEMMKASRNCYFLGLPLLLRKLVLPPSS